MDQPWNIAMYFGRVYYWIEGLTVASYHFDKSFISTPLKTWYSDDGKRVSGGGYSRRSKRYRSAIQGDRFNLAHDFAPKDRDWWEESRMTIPAAKLFMDRTEGNPQFGF